MEVARIKTYKTKQKEQKQSAIRRLQQLALDSSDLASSWNVLGLKCLCAAASLLNPGLRQWASSEANRAAGRTSNYVWFFGGTCGPTPGTGSATATAMAFSHDPKRWSAVRAERLGIGLGLGATKLRSRQTATINFIMAKGVSGSGCCCGSSWRSLHFCELIFVWFFIVIWFLLNIYSPQRARTPDLRKKVKVSAVIAMIECEPKQLSSALLASSCRLSMCFSGNWCSKATVYAVNLTYASWKVAENVPVAT